MSSGMSADRGRADGLAILAASRFNAQGVFFDGPAPAAPPTVTDADLAAFRTPSLRNVASTAPYGHDGRFAKLEDVVAYLLGGGGAADPAHLGTVDPNLVARAIPQPDVEALVAFLGALNGVSPPPPWNDWPQH
jgi:cytochrome c peroxidase